MEQTAPVVAEERISSVDVLRGVALLGILLMNIQNFSLPGAAYGNPSAWAGDTGWNLYYWVTNQILFEGKMRFLFSLLFGAGIVLMTGRAESRGAGVTTADIFLRRNLWLVLLGMIHGYFIWDGDILYSYGMAGLGLFVFRVLSVKKLLISAGVVFLLINLSTIGFFYSQFSSRNDGVAAFKVEEKKRSKEQKAAAETYAHQLEHTDIVKRKVKIEEQIADMRKGYAASFGPRARHTFGSETVAMMKFILWDVVFPMLLGMALYKAGVLSCLKPWQFYARMMLIGYALGIPVLAYATKLAYDSYWDPMTGSWLMATYEYGRLTVGLGHLGLVLLIFKLGLFRPVTFLLAKVGQMALTNYLLTSILMTLLFNGYGLGRFGAFERHQLLYVVFSMWSINLILSPLWLKHFRFGPVEWAWRSPTYWKKQPMRLRPEPIGEPLPPLP
ncbi:MAG: DUF418 domain-containing protein, partial [Chloroflexia bacterium]